VLDLAKAAVRDLQLKVLLHRLMCPMMKESVLTLKALHRVWCEGSLLSIRVKMCTLLNDDSIGVVLQVKQVPHVLGQVWALEIELWAGAITHGLAALLPLRLHLIMNQAECKWCVGSDGEAALTQWSEIHMHHLFDSVIHLIANDGSSPWYCRVDGYLHANLAHIQTIGLKGMAAVAGDQPVVAESDESAQKLSWEPRAVPVHGLVEAILAKCTAGVVICVHLK
jgi:hypothetical protein